MRSGHHQLGWLELREADAAVLSTVVPSPVRRRGTAAAATAAAAPALAIRCGPRMPLEWLRQRCDLFWSARFGKRKKALSSQSS